MTDKQRFKFYNWRIEDNRLISGTTDSGSTITRQILHHDGNIIETTDFILELQEGDKPMTEETTTPETTEEEKEAGAIEGGDEAAEPTAV